MKRAKLECLDCGKIHPLSVDLSGFCDDCVPEERRRERAGMEERYFQMRVEDSGLPEALWNLDWPDNPPAFAARSWAEGNRPGLVLTGGVGVGKTHLAGCAAYRMLRDRGVTWLSVAALMTRLRASFDDEGRARAIHTIQGSGPLVLDDLDKAKPTDFALEILFAAIDQRIVHGTPLLVTTNLPLDHLADKMGDPIASRLAGLKPIEMRGTDRRLAS